MLLKQSLFVISKDELNSIENGTYRHRQAYDAQGNLVDIPVSYTGSSYQRRRPKIYQPSLTIDPKAPAGTYTYIQNKLHVPIAKKPDRPTADVLFQNSLDCSLARHFGVYHDDFNTEKEIEHVFSNRSKSKVVNKIIAWTRANRLRKKPVLYNFLTLTLTSSQIGTDKDFTRMLNVFFTWVRKTYSVTNYLYVLERQKNDNIHAHIIVDRWLPYQKLNIHWCRILGNNGYTFPSKNYDTGQVEEINVYSALKRYLSKDTPAYTGSISYTNPRTGKLVKPSKVYNMPNPLDGETIYNIKTLSRYVTKYVTKNSSIIRTTVWNCSKSISRLWTGAVVDGSKYYSSLKQAVSSVFDIVTENGYIFKCNLLKYYTKLQEHFFSVNIDFEIDKIKLAPVFLSADTA